MIKLHLFLKRRDFGLFYVALHREPLPRPGPSFGL